MHFGGVKALFSYINYTNPQVTDSVGRGQSHAKVFIWGTMSPVPPEGTCLAEGVLFHLARTGALATLRKNFLAKLY